MNFNSHSNLVGLHAFLSASNYHWINYDEDRLTERWLTQSAAARGTRLHKLAHDLIREGIKLPKTRTTMNLYVNDCIGFKMTPEQPLFVSVNCFGTADAIRFKNGKLMVFDLKTGEIEAKITQLEVYAAMFCMEYRFKPFEIDIELRIYQNDDVNVYEADRGLVTHIIDKIVTFDKRINELRLEVES